MFAFAQANTEFISAMLMAIAIQPCVQPMYEELQPEIRTPRTFYVATVHSTIFLIVVFLSVCIASAYAFNTRLLPPIDVGNGVVTAIVADIRLPQAARLAVPIGFALVGVAMFPFMVLPMTAPLKKSLSNTNFFLLNAGIIGSAAIIPMIPSRADVLGLETLNIVNGALSLFLFLGLMPALVGPVLLKWRAWPLVAVALATFLLMVGQLALTAIDLASKV